MVKHLIEVELESWNGTKYEQDSWYDKIVLKTAQQTLKSLNVFINGVVGKQNHHNLLILAKRHSLQFLLSPSLYVPITFFWIFPFQRSSTRYANGVCSFSPNISTPLPFHSLLFNMHINTTNIYIRSKSHKMISCVHLIYCIS